jgi:hypothetical protein
MSSGGWGWRPRRCSRGRSRCRGVWRLRRHRPALADIDANPEKLPLAADRRKQHFGIHLLRHRREKSGHAHYAVRLDLRQNGELRINHRDAGEIEIIAPLRSENLGESRGSIRLESRRAEIAQDSIIAGLVGLVQRQDRRTDEDQNAVAVDAAPEV